MDNESLLHYSVNLGSSFGVFFLRAPKFIHTIGQCFKFLTPWKLLIHRWSRIKQPFVGIAITLPNLMFVPSLLNIFQFSLSLNWYDTDSVRVLFETFVQNMVVMVQHLSILTHLFFSGRTCHQCSDL